MLLNMVTQNLINKGGQISLYHVLQAFMSTQEIRGGFNKRYKSGIFEEIFGREVVSTY